GEGVEEGNVAWSVVELKGRESRTWGMRAFEDGSPKRTRFLLAISSAVTSTSSLTASSPRKNLSHSARKRWRLPSAYFCVASCHGLPVPRTHKNGAMKASSIGPVKVLILCVCRRWPV